MNVAQILLLQEDALGNLERLWRGAAYKLWGHFYQGPEVNLYICMRGQETNYDSVWLARFDFQVV